MPGWTRYQTAASVRPTLWPLGFSDKLRETATRFGITLAEAQQMMTESQRRGRRRAHRARKVRLALDRILNP